MSTRCLLLVGGAQTPEFGRAARRRGFETLVLLSEDEHLAGIGGDEFEHRERVDVDRPQSAILRRILDLHETRRFAAIVPVMQYGLAPAALAARRLGLPGTPPAAVERTANKLRMRQVLEQAGLGQVRYAGCDSPEQVEAFRREVGGPIVVKPMSGTGSDGVSRVDAAEEVPAAFELAATARGSNGVLCEEFVEGPEVSLEGYVVEGRLVPVAITDKRSDARFLELGHSQPSRHPPEAQAAAWRLAERALAALGMTHGMCHTEIRLSARGPVIIETHPRIGGGWIHVLTDLTTGVDLADVAVALALGEAPRAEPRPTGTAAAVAFLPARAGTVSAVEMPPATGEVRRAGLGMFVKPGARLSGRSASWERLAQAVAVGATPEAALETATGYLRSVRIDFDEDRPRRLVFVGGVQIPDLGRAARRRGFESVVLVGGEEDLPDHGGDFDHRERVDVDGPRSAVLRRILDLHEARRFAAVVPVLQYGLAPAALAARRLGLPGTPPAAVERTANKLRMRQVLEQAGLGQVRYAGCDSAEQAEAFRRAVGGPIVVKPMSGTGSDGVSLVEGPEQVAAAFELAATARGSTGVLCEEFVEGPEVSLEGYVVDGRLVPVAVTDKLSDARFLELGHTQPSRHPPEVQADAWELAERALAALGVTHAVCHTEVRLSARGPVLVETHPRMGGDSIHVLTALTTGVDLADATVALALGEAPRALPRPTGVAAAVAFLPARAGTVSAVEMPPATAAVRRAGLGLFVRPGARLSGRSASWERLGHAVAVGPTPEAALEAAARYLAAVRIDFEEDGAGEGRGGDGHGAERDLGPGAELGAGAPSAPAVG